ncbi:hypothetical protein J0656_10700 [Muricauda ruestringensis]|uniref:Uncharacterized protein n=1 Tax=Flagellimonas aurea TaxID=2915619 RepID=A0ABS3G4Z2_9FLAO|nr:hypothetical protein [Allomuricauda aurea]MAO17098.1 hypothetical protein [Allomuricauda sp.]MBO0354485.1 hypothetical protein [Allomuricauda aurea]|tara:strand:+ start:922 stop:1473 length:552 start_codon:yes stop_codon:yes gene_type:complete
MSADFNDYCSDYQHDKRQLDFLKNEFKQEIKEEYPKSGLKGALSQFEFQRVPKVLFRKFKTREKPYGFEISKDNKYDKRLLGMIWFLIALLVWGNLKNKYSWDLSSANVIGILILFIVQLYFIYKGYFYKYPKLMTIQEKGIDLKDDYIYWTDILDYGILQGKGKRSSEKYIIIGTISSGIKK